MLLEMKPLVIASLSALCLSLAAFTLLQPKEAIEARAEGSNYPKATLPTTIYLNPVGESEVRSYYADLNDLGESELQGTNLLKNLKPILMDGQKYYSYDISSGADIWKLYEISDRDWDLCPASATTAGTYDPLNNVITNYSYRTENPIIHALYRNLDVPEAVCHADDHGMNMPLDREHIWPKSRGFDVQGGSGARGDPMHLWPGDHSVNSYLHKNYAYGFVDPSAISIDAGTEYKTDDVVTLAGNYYGLSATLGAGGVFEPQDSDKGDIARSVFYMAARYNNWAGVEDDTIDSENPNLFLEDTTDYKTITSSWETKASIGLIRDLLVWHHLDPVDSYEIRRNDLLYRNFTSNRNPFIDFPEWADYIWGSAEFDAENHRTSSYDPNPTGYVDLDEDVLHGYREDGPTPIDPDVPGPTRYQKTDCLYDGDVISLVYESRGKAFDGIGSGTYPYGVDVDVTIADEAYESESAVTLTVEIDENDGSYYFNSVNGYLAYGGSSTLLTWGSERSGLTAWNVSVLDGDFTFTNVNSGRALYYNTSVASKPWRCYKNSGADYQPFQVYLLDSPEVHANRYSADFLQITRKDALNLADLTRI